MRLENAVKLLEEQYIKAPKDRQNINIPMSYGFDIVIDNMNLNPKELEYYNGVLDGWNNPKGAVPDVVRPKYSLEFKDFFIPLQDCIERDSKRPNPIGEEVIRKTYEKYKDILKV